MKMRLVMMIIAVCLLTACSGITSEAIVDRSTPRYVDELSEPPENAMLVEHLIDEMDQGRGEFLTPNWGEFIVDIADDDFTRGDVIYLNTPDFEYQREISDHKILRIVGMPGEKIKIEKGHVYINGSPLDAFYGEARSAGENREEYIERVGKDQVDEIQLEVYFDSNLKEILIPDQHYFLLGDSWWRAIDSRVFGPVEQSSIIGKIIGYTGDGRESDD